MAAVEPLAVGGLIPNPESNSAATAVLKIGIETLTITKNTVEITPANAALESATVILTLIRVRTHALLPFLQRPLTGE